MNTYKKYYPNVFLAKTAENYNKMELTYANNKVKELKEKLQIAERLWL